MERDTGFRISVIISSVSRVSVRAVIGQQLVRSPEGEGWRLLAGGADRLNVGGQPDNSDLMDKVTRCIRNSLYGTRVGVLQGS